MLQGTNLVKICLKLSQGLGTQFKVQVINTEEL